MDTIVSNSAPWFPLLQPPVRTTVSSSCKLRTATTCLLSSSKKLFLFRSQCPRNSQRCRGPSSVPKFTVTSAAGITEIDESQFSDTVMKSDLPVLVEFVANWCGPCRLISPAMEWVAQEYGNRLRVVKIDHDANPRLIEEYKVYGLPTLILFKNGQEVPESRREGAITKAKLKEYVDALLDSASVA